MTDQEDRMFMNMLFIVIGSLFAFFILIIFIARIVTSSQIAETSMNEGATVERIKPVGEVNVGVIPVAATLSVPADGKATYSTACIACHSTGMMGAPKLGNKEEWKNRITQGLDTLFDHALNGYTGKKGVMPAKGGNAGLSDDAVKAAVQHMVNSSQ